jgi:hypothetical protein
MENHRRTNVLDLPVGEHQFDDSESRDDQNRIDRENQLVLNEGVLPTPARLAELRRRIDAGYREVSGETADLLVEISAQIATGNYRSPTMEERLASSDDPNELLDGDVVDELLREMH